MRSLRISAKSYIPCIIPSKCPIHLPAPWGKASAPHKASSFLLLLSSLFLWMLSSRELLQVPHSTLQLPPSLPLPQPAATLSLLPTGSQSQLAQPMMGNAPQHWQEEAANTANQFLRGKKLTFWGRGISHTGCSVCLTASKQYPTQTCPCLSRPRKKGAGSRFP